jgi:Na+:H+ antiporter
VLAGLCFLIWGVRLYLCKTIIREFVLLRRLSTLSLALFAAWVTYKVDLSPVVGGFVAGAVFALSNDRYHRDDVRIFAAVSELVTPIFFLGVGMQITVLAVNEPEAIVLIVLVLLAAIAGKLFCPWIICSQLKVRERWLLGTALLPRGEVGLVVASIGLQQQHLSHHAMVALIAMTLITAVLSSVSIPRLARAV